MDPSRDPLELDRDFSDLLEDLFDTASSSEESGLELRLDDDDLESLLLLFFISFFLFLRPLSPSRFRDFARGDLSGGSKGGFSDCILSFVWTPLGSLLGLGRSRLWPSALSFPPSSLCLMICV